MSLPPLPDLCTWGKTVLTREDMIQVRMREYGELCRKMALEEALTACETRTDRLEAIRELLK